MAALSCQFEYFCSTSPAHDAIQENKALLRARFEEARALGGEVAASKGRIAELRSRMEQRRLQLGLAAALGGGEAAAAGRPVEDPEEERAKGLIDKVPGRAGLGGAGPVLQRR